jgi:aspartate aminotransferase-like enzyme
VNCPDGVDEEAVRKTLLQEFSLEIGAGTGPAQGQDLALRA